MIESVIWTLDRESEKRVAALQRAVAQDGAKPVYPHITLAVYEFAPLPKLHAQVRRFLALAHPFTLTYESLALFGDGALALRPGPCAALSRYHRLFHQRLTEYADQWTNLTTGLYVPHTTLVQGAPDAVEQAMKTAKDLFTPFEARVTGLRLSLMNRDGFFRTLRQETLR